jgi:hypothetical protein
LFFTTSKSEWTSRNLRFPPLLLKEHRQASLSGVPLNE